VLCKSKLRYCLKLTVIETRSLNVPPAEELCKVDVDRDPKGVGMVEATVLMSVAVKVQTAEAPEVMEEAKGSVVKLSLVLEEGDHTEGMSWQLAQLEQLEHKLLEVTTGYVSLAAEEAVERALGESLDVQEVPGVSAMARAEEPETVPRQG